MHRGCRCLSYVSQRLMDASTSWLLSTYRSLGSTAPISAQVSWASRIRATSAAYISLCKLLQFSLQLPSFGRDPQSPGQGQVQSQGQESMLSVDRSKPQGNHHQSCRKPCMSTNSQSLRAASTLVSATYSPFG